jgi:hypothetical protein
MSSGAEFLLQYFTVPLWLSAGVADWYCHRRARISVTAGPFESVLHVLMFGEIGIAMLACLFCEINALILLLLIVVFLLHEATSLWDVRYATGHREVTYVEQHVHSFLELMPLMALILLASIHWEQACALFMFNGTADWSLRWKAAPLPYAYTAALLSAATVMGLLPYLQELWSGWRAQSQAVAPRPSRALTRLPIR